jgi:drug/metabolite transporter (DMT)-like permease
VVDRDSDDAVSIVSIVMVQEEGFPNHPEPHQFGRQPMNENPSQRRLGRSIVALLAGFVLVVILSVVTDMILHLTQVYPPLGQPMSDGLLLLATVYRTIYGVAGSYITARLAPYRPMQHALVGGLIGLVLSLIGLVTTWNRPDTSGAHWYPILLVILALPTAWIGGKICVMQSGDAPG